MVNSGLLPIDGDEDNVGGNFLTFIVSAPQGCNLKCPFCVVRQRKEMTGDLLSPGDLVRFIREAAARASIYALAIQGYEPLLPASREHTEAVLATGRSLDLPTALVTNGVLLRDAVHWLAPLAPTRIGISLDAASADAHDRIRGVPGAWAATVDGIRHAGEVLAPRTSLVVASVLTSHREPLDDMPKLLRSLGITHWIISPLQKIGRDRVGGPTGNRETLYRNLLTLQQAADHAGIHLNIDDELDCLRHDLAVARDPELGKLRVRTLPEGVDLFRLVPSGQCSLNQDILRQVTPDTARWRPGEMDAGEFIEGLKLSTGEFAHASFNRNGWRSSKTTLSTAHQIPAYHE